MSTETSDGVTTPSAAPSVVSAPTPPPSRRALIPRIFSRAQPSGAVDQLIKTVRLHHPKSDLALLERAYATAERAHSGQKRRSGEPYITHPVAVAQILADLGIGTKTLAAALLRRGSDARGWGHEARQTQVRR
jgi:guanosine-3',5'-bis(diphosphate) 3'-pyrophosphohydrolase